jgi:hypothetical protein
MNRRGHDVKSGGLAEEIATIVARTLVWFRPNRASMKSPSRSRVEVVMS